VAWLTVPITSQDVRDTFPELVPEKIPSKNVADFAIVSAEGFVRPLAEMLFGIADAPSKDTTRIHVIQAAAAYCYRSAWGLRAFGATEAATAADKILSDIKEYFLDLIKIANEIGTVPAGSTATQRVTSAGDTSAVYSLGKPETWPEPSNEIATDAEERRRF